MQLCLSQDAKVVLMNNNVASGTGTTNTSIFDLGEPGAAGGFDAVMVIVVVNACSAGSVVTVRLQDNTANQTGGMATCTAATFSVSQQNTANATGAQDSTNAGVVATDVGGGMAASVIVLDVIQPQKRYVRAQVVVATANATLGGVIGVLYRTKCKPVALDATNLINATALASS